MDKLYKKNNRHYNIRKYNRIKKCINVSIISENNDEYIDKVYEILNYKRKNVIHIFPIQVFKNPILYFDD
jgi:sulfite reductase alpha subunit-like flavoprotein